MNNLFKCLVRKLTTHDHDTQCSAVITGNMKQRVLPSRTQDKLVSTVSTVNGFYVASQRWLVFLPVPRWMVNSRTLSLLTINSFCPLFFIERIRFFILKAADLLFSQDLVIK